MSELDPNIKAQAEQLAADNPDSMVAVFRPDGTYLYVSPSHVDLMGFTPEELTGIKLPDRIHPDDLDHTNLAFMDAVLHGKSVEVGVRVLHKSGRPVRVRASARHVLGINGADFMLGMATPLPDED